MPWRGAVAEKEATNLAFPTLGITAWQWIEDHCVIPDGDRQGDPLRLTDEMIRFLLHFYRVDADRWQPKYDGPRFHYERGGQLVRPQKWGKGPFSAALICFEAVGPAVPDGWDADGAVVGRPWSTPTIQITAISEEQTDNVFRALVPMIQLGPLDPEIPDTGITRINLPGGGKIEPVTASARSRLGQRLTFSVQDEALALDTPLPTPTGWTTMAEVVEGDELIGANGLPVTVLAATDVQTDRVCYRVTFEDGTAIVASDGHLWQTRVASSAAQPRIRSTGEMIADGRRFRVPTPLAYKLPEVDLPVDPYLLGLWLGDGSAGQCHLTAGAGDVADIVTNLAAVGVETTSKEDRPGVYRVSFSSRRGQQGSLRPECAKALARLACYRSKHIPAEYFRASVDQRVALLRGLMDSDGYVNPDTGVCTFAGNRRLGDDTVALLRTLGQVVHVNWHADPRSREGGGTKIEFMPRWGLVPFALDRKASLVRSDVRSTRQAWVTIRSIEPVPSVPVRCIEVDAHDHLFLAGEGGHVTHNTHSWTERSNGVRLADNQRRNMAGMGGRWIETTNAWDITEGSVAQLTYEQPVGVFVDYPQPIAGSIRNKAERRKAMRHAYGDSVRNGPTWKGWVDLDRIDIEIEALTKRDPAQAERFFLNRVHAGEDVIFDVQKWAELARPSHVVPDNAIITIGVDGARYDDALAVIATEVGTFHQWPLIICERPPNAAPDYEHDLDDVDAAVSAAFDRFDVALLYADPQYIEGLVDVWMGRYGKERVAKWLTNQPSSRKVGMAVAHYVSSVHLGDMTHDGDSVFTRHIHNARRKSFPTRDEEGRPMFSLQKDRSGSRNKIDAAMAGMLSCEARRDAIAKGALNKRPARWFMGV